MKMWDICPHHQDIQLLKSTLPSRPAFFVGREKEVEEVHKKLSENDIVFLSGVGGIGKTELAKYYAHI